MIFSDIVSHKTYAYFGMYNNNLTENKLNSLYLRLLGESDAVVEPTPGEAPAQVPTGAVLNEPSLNGGSSDTDLNFSMDDFLKLYPDIVNVDVTDPGELAKYFTMLDQAHQAELAKEADAKIVPGAAAAGSDKEFI